MTQISYQLTAMLAEGSIYKVYKGLSYLPDGETREILLKQLQPHIVNDPVIISHLAGFSDVARGLQHPNLAPLWDLGQHNGNYYHVREYLPGCSLHKLLDLVQRGEAILSPAMAIYITQEISEAIAALHRHRVPGDQPIYLFHGGLSPENIILTRTGGVVVTDAGLDVIFWRDPEIQKWLRHHKGAYHPPEYSMGQRPMRRGDAFGVGALLYHMIMGQSLRDASPHWFDSLHMSLPSEHHHRVTEQFDQLLKETLHPNQDHRQVLIDQLRQQLARPGLLRQAKAERREAAAYIEALVSQVLEHPPQEVLVEIQPPFHLESLLPERPELLPPHKRYQPPKYDETSSFHPRRKESTSPDATLPPPQPLEEEQEPLDLHNVLTGGPPTQSNSTQPSISPSENLDAYELPPPEPLYDPDAYIEAEEEEDDEPTNVAPAPVAPPNHGLTLGDLLNSEASHAASPPEERPMPMEEESETDSTLVASLPVSPTSNEAASLPASMDLSIPPRMEGSASPISEGLLSPISEGPSSPRSEEFISPISEGPSTPISEDTTPPTIDLPNNPMESILPNVEPTPETMALPIEDIDGYPGILSSPPPDFPSNQEPLQADSTSPQQAPPMVSQETVALPLEQITGSQAPPKAPGPLAPPQVFLPEDGMEQFGNFVLLNRVAFGGMAEVFRARLQGHVGFQRIVAVKRILPEYSEDPTFIQMFTDEARIAGSLTHPHIVQINELGEVDGIYYISMEFIDGIDLARVIKIRRTLEQPIPLGIILDITIPVCKALHYAHTALDPNNKPLNMIHRDVTPHNILISKKAEIKLTDFGIAKASQNISTTAVGELKGKLSYMSPEQAEGRPLDQRTDIFQVGIVLYEMLTLRKMFEGNSDKSVLHKIQNGLYPTPRQVTATIPELMEQITLKALAVDPKHRYQTAQELEQDLVKLRNNLPVQERSADVATFTTQILEQRDFLLAEMAANRGKPRPMSLANAPHQTPPIALGQQQTPGSETQARHVQTDKKKTAMLSGLIVFIMLVVGGVVGYFLLKEKPVPPQAPFSIQTRPPGAEVRLDGEKIGVTPLRINRPFDKQKHVLQLIKRGYRPFNHKFKLQHEGDGVDLFLSLNPNPKKRRKP